MGGQCVEEVGNVAESAERRSGANLTLHQLAQRRIDTGDRLQWWIHDEGCKVGIWSDER